MHPGPVPGQVAQVVGGILGVVALACALLAALSYGKSPTGLGDGPALYTQQGTFAYEAQVPAGPVYENGRLTTGQPAYVQVVRSLRVSFDYEVATTAPHTLFGTTGLTAEMANGSGWSRTFPLAAKTAFAGDRVTVTGILQLAALRALAARVEAVTGQVPDTYTITIRPQVTLSGQVDGTAVKDAFSPPLQLNLDRYKLTLPPPGATPDGELQRAQDGPATKQRVANTLSVLGAKLEVQSARRLATVLGLAALAGALGVGLLFLLRLRRADEPARIRARFGHLIVEIAVPRRRFAEHDVVMASFEDLVRVSDRHGRMILHARDGDRHVYLVEDDGIAYRFEAEARPEPRSPDILGGPLGGGPLGGESPPPPRARRALALRGRRRRRQQPGSLGRREQRARPARPVRAGSLPRVPQHGDAVLLAVRDEHGVEAEALAAGRRVGDAPGQQPCAAQLRTVRQQAHELAHIAAAPAFAVNPGQCRQQPAHGVVAAEPRRVHPGAAIQAVDLDPRVLGDHPGAGLGVGAAVAGLDAGVAGVGVGILGRVVGAGDEDVERPADEDRAELLELVAVAGGDADDGREHGQQLGRRAQARRVATATSCACSIRPMPSAARSSSPSRSARVNATCSAVACTSTSRPSPVITTLRSTSALESSE